MSVCLCVFVAPLSALRLFGQVLRITSSFGMWAKGFTETIGSDPRTQTDVLTTRNQKRSSADVGAEMTPVSFLDGVAVEQIAVEKDGNDGPKTGAVEPTAQEQ